MRFLFTFVGGQGHFEPLVPIAEAAAAAGHSVAFGCGVGMVSHVEDAGFRAYAIGSRAGRPPERTPLLPIDREREDRDLRERFARDAAGYRAPRIVKLCQEWQPQLIVCDETDFGAMVAAEVLDLPHVTVLVIAAGSFVRDEVVGAALRELRATHGLPGDLGLEMLSRYLVLSPFPRSLRDPADPLPRTAHSLRSSTPGERGATPAWGTVVAGAPTIYFTLGTIFNMESGDLFARVLAGLGELRCNVVATVGRHIDPAEFSSQPASIHIERYLPQASVLPHCDAVVSHGGSGSVVGALTHGLPSVLIPLGADQPLNAARCASLGVARVLDAIDATPEIIKAALGAVLNEPSYRRSAKRLQREIESLPEAAIAVGLLERLALERRPLLAE